MYFRTILKLFIEFLRTVQKKSINQNPLINTLSDFCNFLEFPQNCYRMVEVTGIEPATSWSQTTRATNCATPRNIIFCSTLIYNSTYFRDLQQFLQIFLQNLQKYLENYSKSNYNIMYAPVAQLDRVFGYEPEGRGFESLLVHQIDIKLEHLYCSSFKMIKFILSYLCRLN